MIERRPHYRLHDGTLRTFRPRPVGAARGYTVEVWTQNHGPVAWADRIAAHPIGGFPY